VLKCGGGKALTKQPSEETALKCHATIEGAGKIGEVHTLVICGAPVNPLLEDKFEVPLRNNGMKIKKMRLGKITPELYNLEDNTESEKPMKINLDLDLYQMEEV
jgi:hypothetical protein